MRFTITIFVIVLSCFFSSMVNGADNASIELYLNSPIDKPKPLHTTESPIGTALLDLINNAETSLDLAIYGIRHQPEIIEALEQAKDRGIKIRIVIDKQVDGTNIYSDTPLLEQKFSDVVSDHAIDEETAAKPPIKFPPPMWEKPEGFLGPPQCIGYSLDDNKAIIAVHCSRDTFDFAGDIMHNKYAVADNKVVWTGSCNLSDSGTGGYNANVAVVVESPEVAEMYTAEFERMYDEGLFHRKKKAIHRAPDEVVSINPYTSLKVGFSPQNRVYERMIKPLVENAEDSIDLAIFFLTHKYATGDLIKAHQRGVKVRVIMDATAATNGYTKHQILREVGVPVKIEDWGGKMHMKSVCIDKKYLVVGSMNWTSSGEGSNDENSLIIESKPLSRDFTEYYNEIWDDIDDRWLTEQPDPESSDSRFSMTDGVDNDFDKLVDTDDPGWGPEPPPLPPHKIVPLEDGHLLIKGNINKDGKKIYHVATDKYYPQTKINPQYGERYFPSIWEAKDAGWRRTRSR